MINACSKPGKRVFVNHCCDENLCGKSDEQHERAGGQHPCDARIPFLTDFEEKIDKREKSRQWKDDGHTMNVHPPEKENKVQCDDRDIENSFPGVSVNTGREEQNHDENHDPRAVE